MDEIPLTARAYLELLQKVHTGNKLIRLCLMPYESIALIARGRRLCLVIYSVLYTNMYLCKQ